MALGSRRYWPGLLAVGALVALFGVGYASYAAHGATYRFVHPPRDLVVGGRVAPETGNLESWLAALPSDEMLDEVLLFGGEEHRIMAASELGYAIDVDRTLKRIELAAPEPNVFIRFSRAFFPQPTRTVVAPAVSFDEERARQELVALQEHYHRPAVDASLDVRAHRKIDDVPGRALNVEATLARLAQHESSGEPVALAFDSVPARVRSEDLLQVDVSQVLATFDTDFRKKAGRRALNIRRAASLLDGHVISPGETMSFNRVVGDRSESNGFVWAPVIINDEMEPGIGGGVCQVATTLHAAAVLGGLAIEERRSHSRPSGYAPLGLDAAVIYGEVDLRIKNPYATPLLVHAYLPSEFVIRVELLGATNSAELRHKAAVVERHDFYRRIVVNPALEAGQFERTQEGGFGYDVISSIERMAPDGSTEVRRYSSKYYPVPEVYNVGPGTSESDLPPLPDGALGLEPAASDDAGDLATN